MREQWALLEQRARERLGEQWEIWGAGSHPHRLSDEGLVVALRPELAPYVATRWAHILAALSEHPVAVVGCQTLEAVRG